MGMNIIAHSGIDHSSTAEAAAHSSPNVIMTVILVTTAVFIVMAAATLAVRRLGRATEPVKNQRED